MEGKIERQYKPVGNGYDLIIVVDKKTRALIMKKLADSEVNGLSPGIDLTFTINGE